MDVVHIYRFFLLLIVTIGAFSCNRKLNPQQPEEKYNQVKMPAGRQLSVINIPVSISMAEVEKQINTRLKDLLYEDSSLENNGNDNLMLKVWKRDPITVQALHDVFHITVPLKIWAKGGLPLDKLGIHISEFKETEFALNVHFATKVSIDKDWQVHTQTSANGFDWISKPVLKIGFLEFSLASVAGRMIDKQQDKLAAQIDQQVEQNLDIRKHIEQGWHTLQQPLLISKQYEIWLRILPSQVLMTPISGQGRQATALIGIKAFTETSFGQKPEVEAKEQIPALEVVQHIPDSISIGLMGEISHTQASNILRENFLNKDFTFNEGKHHVTLTGIDLYGSGENLVIKAGLTGSAEGNIYLKGKPYFDPATQSVMLQNLDYDLDTKNKLLKTANWLAKGRFVQKMQEAFRLPLEKQITQAKELIQANLTGKQIAKGIVLNGQLDKLTPSEVYITPTSIVATALAKGKVKVHIEGISK